MAAEIKSEAPAVRIRDPDPSLHTQDLFPDAAGGLLMFFSESRQAETARPAF